MKNIQYFMIVSHSVLWVTLFIKKNSKPQACLFVCVVLKPGFSSADEDSSPTKGEKRKRDPEDEDDEDDD